MDIQILKEMVDRWPSNIVCRSEVSAFTGGLISAKTLANADCRGKGPTPRLRYGGKVAYPTTAIAEFAAMRLKIEEAGE